MFCKEICLVFHFSLFIGSSRVSSSGSDWPSGWYGLPQPKTDCPSSSEWCRGWRHEERRLNNQSAARVPQYSNLKGTFTQNITKRYFCIKTKDNGQDNPWPNGQYCIYQMMFRPCPPGFVNGSIGWENKDAPNGNKQSGMVPSGVFASSTRFNYCCKVDGSKENSITLPVNRPFLLLAYNSSECQSVKWARTTQEYLRFSVQEEMTFKRFHPFVDDNYALRYCYYQSSNKTLTTSQGTISRYLNQTSVHQERHTVWCIKPYSPLPFQSLVVRFTRFTFHASNINSYLEVLDGCNESAPSLGRFSSTQSPLGQNITSSTSQLFVLLHFDDRIGTYDFEFNYHIWSPTVSTTAEINTPSHPPTSITSHSTYTSSSKVTSLPSTTLEQTTAKYFTKSTFKVTSLPWTTLEQTTTKYFTKSTFSRSSYYNNFTIPTNSTINHLYSHGNNIKKRLLLYTLLPTGGLVMIIGIAVILVRRRKKRIVYSRLTSLSIDEIVSELNENMDECDRLELGTSCAVLQVTSEEHQTETGMSTRMSREHKSSDSDDEMIRLDRNPPDFPSTELQNVNTRPRPCRYESDPVPDHSSHVTNEELRQLHEKDEEDKMSEAERIALIKLFGEEQQDQYHLPKHKPTETKDQASDC